MILHDDGIEIPEAYLRNILQTDRTGTDLSQIPKTLEIFGAKQRFTLVRLRTIDELKDKSWLFPTIAVVKVRGNDNFHTILIDKIFGDFVFVRDPLPSGQGKSYKVKMDDFTANWIQKKTGNGLAIVVI